MVLCVEVNLQELHASHLCQNIAFSAPLPFFPSSQDVDISQKALLGLGC